MKKFIILIPLYNDWKSVSKLLNEIDTQINNWDAEVMSIEYDPNRSAFIALLKYDDEEKRYIIAQKGLKIGQKVVSGEDASTNLGNAMPLAKIPLGTVISCIELKPGKGASMARSAGSFAEMRALSVDS